MRRFAVGILAIASVVSLPHLAFAQQAQSSVQGHVVDESGLPLPGVTVVVTHEGAVSVVVVGRDFRPRMKRWIPAQPEDVRGVILVGDGVWLRLAAPLGDVIVAQQGPDLDL